MREEDLLGYLLNAVDAAQRRRVDEALKRDPSLRRRLDALRQRLGSIRNPSADDADEFEPPEGLLEQTCDLVEGCHQRQTRRGRHVSRGERTAAGDGWSLGDYATATGLFLALAMLFFPAIANSRYRSHIQVCQHNLQQLGLALCQFSQVNQGSFPQIPLTGNRAAAGIYAPTLFEQGFLDDRRILICPSSQQAVDLVSWRLPRLDELDAARGRQLEQLRARMGGSYGYTLGYRVGERYFPPRNEARVFFALMSDAPSLHLEGRRSSNHCGRGQNVLFEDLHLEFIIGVREPTEPAVHRNALYVNRNGYAEAGVDRNDYVIGSSSTPPLLLSPAVNLHR